MSMKKKERKEVEEAGSRCRRKDEINFQLERGEGRKLNVQKLFKYNEGRQRAVLKRIYKILWLRKGSL